MRTYRFDEANRLLTITASGTTQTYTVLPLEAGEFRLVKHGSTDVYEVQIAQDPNHDLCTCPANKYRSRCKHADALRHWLTNTQKKETGHA